MCHIIVQYSTDQLIKEVENSIEEFKRYNQDYDEGNIKQQVSRQFFLIFSVLNSFSPLQSGNTLLIFSRQK
jgi:hypothetical protein